MAFSKSVEMDKTILQAFWFKRWIVWGCIFVYDCGLANLSFKYSTKLMNFNDL